MFVLSYYSDESVLKGLSMKKDILALVQGDGIFLQGDILIPERPTDQPYIGTVERVEVADDPELRRLVVRLGEEMVVTKDLLLVTSFTLTTLFGGFANKRESWGTTYVTMPDYPSRFFQFFSDLPAAIQQAEHEARRYEQYRHVLKVAEGFLLTSTQGWREYLSMIEPEFQMYLAYPPESDGNKKWPGE